jgi:single stranded DNA-binding protein
VKLDNGKNATIPLKTYKHVDYGWASTTHKAQGMTVDRAYVYGHTKEHMASQQVAYVQISRARENTQLYIVNGEKSIERPQPPLETGKEMPAQPLKATSAERKEALDDMKRSWSRDAAKGTSLDYVRDNEQEKQSLDEKRVAPQELLQDREIEQQQKKDESRSAGAEAEKSKEPAVKPDKVRFAGRLARDPEFRAFPEGKAVAELSVVFQRKVKDEQGQWQEKSSVIPVTVRQEQALWARDHLKKGQAILVEGHMRTQERQTAQGPEKQMTVEATKIQDLSQKKDRDMDLER